MIENENNGIVSNEVDLYKLFAQLWEKRYKISIITGIFTLLGIIYAFLIATPMFMSSITLYPANQEKNSNSQLQVLAAQFGFGGFSSSNDFNIPDFVKSRRLRKKILAKKWMTKKNPNIAIYLYDFWEIDGDSLIVRKELALEKLSELISVGTDDETELITISILTEEPQLSANIVNFIGEEVTRYISEEKQYYGKENRKFIERRLADTKAELTAAEVILKKFRENNRASTETPELQLEYRRLKRNLNIKEEIYLTLAKQRELAIIEEAKDTPIINILDVGEKPIKKTKPRRALIVLVYLLIGGIVGVLSCFISPFNRTATEKN